MLKHLILKFIRFYKHTEPTRTEIAKQLFLPVHTCRFVPTCSEYTYEAVERFGVVKGLWLGAKRLIRCGPWTKPGLDPVPK